MTKSIAAKKLSGTYRPDMMVKARSGGWRPRMPKGLEPGVQVVWRRLVPVLADAGILAPSDMGVLIDYCVCVFRLETVEAEIARDGATIPGRDQQAVRNPAVMVANAYRSQVTKYAHRFLCDPAARAGMVPVAPSEKTLAETLNEMVRDARAPAQPGQEPPTEGGTE